MKRVILFIGVAIALLSTLAAQESVKWYSIEEAVQLASQEPRVLVIDVYTDWCGWCKRMDADTFSDPAVAEIMNKHFYPVKLNAEGKEDVHIADGLLKDLFAVPPRRGRAVP